MDCEHNIIYKNDLEIFKCTKCGLLGKSKGKLKAEHLRKKYELPKHNFVSNTFILKNYM